MSDWRRSPTRGSGGYSAKDTRASGGGRDGPPPPTRRRDDRSRSPPRRRERSHERVKDRDWRDRDRDRDRDTRRRDDKPYSRPTRSRSRSPGRHRERVRERDRERDGGPRDKDRERDRDREKEKDKDRERRREDVKDSKDSRLGPSSPQGGSISTPLDRDRGRDRPPPLSKSKPPPPSHHSSYAHHPPRISINANAKTTHNQAPSRTIHTPTPMDLDATPEEGESLSDSEAQMKALMGFGGFDTTKAKHVEGNQEGGAKVNKQRTWRQYMNRRGGFNRPLDKTK